MYTLKILERDSGGVYRVPDEIKWRYSTLCVVVEIFKRSKAMLLWQKYMYTLIEDDDV